MEKLKKSDEEWARRQAEQDFINLLIQQTFDAGAFDLCPDRDNLYNIVELALRLALTCHKQDGQGPVNGYGIKTAFVKAVRNHKEDHERDKLANKRYAKRKKAMAKTGQAANTSR